MLLDVLKDNEKLKRAMIGFLKKETGVLDGKETSRLFCPVCEKQTNVVYLSKYKGKTQLFSRGGLYKCFDCEIIFFSPLPTTLELDEYYKVSWLGKESVAPSSKAMDLIYEIQGRERCKYLTKHNILQRSQKVLDVGSGYGHMFESIWETHSREDMQFFAIDPSPICQRALREKGINAYSSISDLEEQEFDLITLGEVLEHVPNPVTFLRSLIELVKEGGHIYIDIPDRDDTHKALLEPHVLVFSPTSFLSLVNKCDLEVVHITGFGVKRRHLVLPFSYIKRVIRLVKKGSRSVFRSDSEEKKLQNYLYDFYRFNNEGDHRWWMRAIVRVHK